MEENNRNTEPMLTLQPELVLDPNPAAPESALFPETPAIPEAPAVQLSKQEELMVSEFAEKIDLTNAAQVLQYGIGAQQKVSAFSESALANVRGKDLGEVGEMITGLVGELKSFQPEEEKRGLRGLFRKAGDNVGQIKAKYESVEQNVDRICDNLEGHKMVLLKDVAMLDQMYEMNLAYYRELTMYILAGRRKLEQTLKEELPVLQQRAQESGSQEDAQDARHLAEMCGRFDKKLHDLDLTRVISMQMAPQIRMVQNNNSILVDKIQSSLVNTIPLWKNQMVLALGLAHSKDAMEAQRQVSDLTNELLRKNADTLKTSTLGTAKEAERSIVDIETLQHTNASLISTLDEVMQIQAEGRAKRREAEGELVRIEEELRQKLLEVRTGTLESQ